MDKRKTLIRVGLIFLVFPGINLKIVALFMLKFDFFAVFDFPTSLSSIDYQFFFKKSVPKCPHPGGGGGYRCLSMFQVESF